MEWTFEKSFETSREFVSFVPMFPYVGYEVVEFVKSKVYYSRSKSFDDFWFNFAYYHPLIYETFQTFDILGLLLQFGRDISFYYHLPFKDVDIDSFFRKIVKEVVPKNIHFKLLFSTF